ncbi:MAG: hypothetical protein J0L55_08340, partial [Caulobacterales bacterium]|nr:hypothetical protein [Caulobacterales bacterium]
GNCMGKSEMMVVLPPDPRMMVEIAMFLKTEKYIQQKNKIANADATKSILFAKGEQNRSRFTRIIEIVKDAITNAKFIVSGNLVDVSTSEPVGRINDAFQDLISVSYKHLKMLKGVTYKDEDISNFLDPNRLFSVSESTDQEAQNEVLNYIKTQLIGANRVTVKMVIDHFERKPYGWQLTAILCLIAANIGRGNLEILRDAVSIDAKDLPNLLKNTQAQQNLYFRTVTAYSDGQVKILKDLYFEFLGQTAETTDAKQIATNFLNELKKKLADTQNLHNQISTFPFLSKLDSAISLLSEVAKYSVDDFITKSNDFHDKLLDIKDDILNPIDGFMNGNGRIIFQDARDFINAHKFDMDFIDKSKFDELQNLLNSPNAYTGKNPVTIKELHNALHLSLLNAVNNAKQAGKSKIDDLYTNFKAQEAYSGVSESAKHEFDHQFNAIKQKLDCIDSIASIEQNTRHFEDKIFPNELAKLFNLNQPTGGNDTPKPVIIVNAKDVKPSFNKSLIDNETDLDEYLSNLKTALMAEIQSGKKVQI